MWTDGLIPIDENGNIEQPHAPSLSGSSVQSEDGDEYEGGAFSYAAIFVGATLLTMVGLKFLRDKGGK